MACNVPPFAAAVLAEATRIAPGRRTSSDGVCGDAAHQAEVSDHNPSGPNGYAHAVDISQSTPGSPYWDPKYGQFNAHWYGYRIAERMLSGVEKRVKYLVSFDGYKDVIFNLAVAPYWRQNGDAKTDHANHLHVSFWPEAEQSVAPLFGVVLAPLPPKPLPPLPPPPPPVTTTIAEDAMSHFTDITMNLDDAGSGHVPVKGVKAKDCYAWGVIAVSDPQVTHRYGPIARVALTIGVDTDAEIVLVGGPPHGRASVRVVHA